MSQPNPEPSAETRCPECGGLERERNGVGVQFHNAGCSKLYTETPTPLTDFHLLVDNERSGQPLILVNGYAVVTADFARTLERRLAAAQAEAEQYKRQWSEDFDVRTHLLAERDAAIATVADLRKQVAELSEAMLGMVEDYEVEHGDGICDCRPEPENVGHVCNVCLARAAINAARASKGAA